MEKKVIKLIVLFFLLSSCSPRISTKIYTLGKRMNNFDQVILLSLEDLIPEGAVVIGLVKMNDNSSIFDCNYKRLMLDAKNEARKIGGNVIKIINHEISNSDSLDCHKIVAKILYVEDQKFIEKFELIDSNLIGKNYSLIHFYRPSGFGFLINFNIHDENTVLTRAKDDWKTSIRIRETGKKDLWARTEVKTVYEINIEKEKNYYVKCGIEPGLIVGHPTMSIMDSETGRYEFNLINDSSYVVNDYIMFKDSVELQCEIIREDEMKVYIKYREKGKKTKKYFMKSKILNIDRDF